MTTATWTAADGTVRPLDDITRIDALNQYRLTFAGREDCYAAWGGDHWITACAPGCPRCSWMGSHRGEDPDGTVPAHVRAPLTLDVVDRAFRSGRPVSGYILAPDSTTHIAALDIDLERGVLIADKVASTMARAGVPAYIEPSSRGAHLWTVLERPLPALVIRYALRAFLAAAGAPDDPKVELRPAQDRLNGPDGVGTALRLPLMAHQRTGKRGELWEPGGRIVAREPWEAVLAVESAPATAFLEWSERWSPPVPDLPPMREGERPRNIDRFNDQVGVTEVLIRDWGALDARPGKSIRCPSPDHGGPDRNPSCRILPDDRRVYCHRPGCSFSGRGKDAWDLAQSAPGVRSGAA